MWTKIIIAVIVIGAALGGGWWYINNYSASSSSRAAAAPAPLVVSDNVPPAPAPTPGTPNSVVIPATGSSDDALAQESAEVDAQISGLDSDNAKSDSSLSSQ